MQVPGSKRGRAFHRPTDLGCNAGPSAIPCEIPVVNGYLTRICEISWWISQYLLLSPSRYLYGVNLVFPNCYSLFLCLNTIAVHFPWPLLWCSSTLLSLGQDSSWKAWLVARGKCLGVRTTPATCTLWIYTCVVYFISLAPRPGAHSGHRWSPGGRALGIQDRYTQGLGWLRQLRCQNNCQGNEARLNYV